MPDCEDCYFNYIHQGTMGCYAYNRKKNAIMEDGGCISKIGSWSDFKQFMSHIYLRDTDRRKLVKSARAIAEDRGEL